MKIIADKLFIAVALVAVATNVYGCSTDKRMARRNLRHEQNHLYVRNRFHFNQPVCFMQSPAMERLQIDFLFDVIGAIAHSKK